MLQKYLRELLFFKGAVGNPSVMRAGMYDTCKDVIIDCDLPTTQTLGWMKASLPTPYFLAQLLCGAGVCCSLVVLSLWGARLCK